MKYVLKLPALSFYSLILRSKATFVRHLAKFRPIPPPGGAQKDQTEKKNGIPPVPVGKNWGEKRSDDREVEMPEPVPKLVGISPEFTPCMEMTLRITPGSLE